MKVLLVLVCAVVGGGVLAGKPPCKSPALLTGALTVATQNEQLWTYARYQYDALGERMRLHEFGQYNNKTFTVDVLLHYREAVMYLINHEAKTCKKQPLADPFRPIGVPKNASFLASYVVGSSSGVGQGLLVDTWMGTMKNGKYLITMTEFGCIPVSVSFQTPKFGWMVVSYFNNVIGIVDPDQLNPPDFCLHEGVQTEKRPGDFFSAFLKD